METKFDEITIYRGRELGTFAQTTLERVFEEIKKKNYRCNLLKDEVNLDVSKFTKCSYNRTKKINRSLRRLNKTMTIKSMNIVISWILHHVIGEKQSFNVKVSQKEETIQNKRKLWLEARTKADKLLLEYKEEKGNFYK